MNTLDYLTLKVDIEIENANFVINQMEQGCYDKAYLYTKIMELEQLEYLARLTRSTSGRC